MLTKIFAALAAAVAIGATGVYYATSPGTDDSHAGCPSKANAGCTPCALMAAACTDAEASESEGGCCPLSKASPAPSGQSLATAAAFGGCTAGTECGGSGICDKVK